MKEVSYINPNLFAPKNASDTLSMEGKAAMMKVAIKHGIYSLKEIKQRYNEYAEGGKAEIHIKPENRGKFTALKERTGHSASWFKAHGTPAQKKMAVFALNTRKWKHGEGGPLVEYANIYKGGGVTYGKRPCVIRPIPVHFPGGYSKPQ